ncbi:MAG: hemin receptor [Chloroflexi bacterium]|nr:hemin receptor [Chloroflexota bacterium]
MSNPMTSQQRNLVRRSFTYIAPEHAAVARLFYDKLFEIAPDLRHMFKHDMDMQRAKVMQMLASLVSSLDDTAHFDHTSHELGKRHVGYGVSNPQYKLVGQALIWALQEACPTIMTPAVTEAWAAAYTKIAEAAIEGAANTHKEP